MSKLIRPIHFEEQSVGRRIKSSKKHYIWKFALEGKIYTVDLFSSKFSGKKKIKIDGEVRFQGKKQGKIFHISVDIGSHSILIIEVGKSYDLRIDGISFQILQKQLIFSPHLEESENNAMSEKLICENQEEWETAARPYKIIIREGLSSTTREILPITLKKPRGRLTISKPIADERFIFSTGNLMFGDDYLNSDKGKQKEKYSRVGEFSTSNGNLFQ